tara:strand:- start:205 stop:423 length:219 start_codon:yes stop_codon:yes gene_type:complete
MDLPIYLQHEEWGRWITLIKHPRNKFGYKVLRKTGSTSFEGAFHDLQKSMTEEEAEFHLKEALHHGFKQQWC